MLEESEWNTINNILLDLYTVNDMKQLSGKVLHLLRMMIPFSKGCFAMLDEKGFIDNENSVFAGFDAQSEKKYRDKYLYAEYEKYSFNPEKGAFVFRNIQMLDGGSMEDAGFYGKFLSSEGITYEAGVGITENGRIRGILSLFRSERLGGFSEKSVYILNIMKRHLENIVRNVCLMDMQNFDIVSSKCFDSAVSDFALSQREAEILRLIADGKSNAEICSGLCVSISTVKKHVYNIFNKAGVNSRTQLLNQIYRMRKGS